MSLSKLEEISCRCGETFEAELWNAINVSHDPGLKEALLCGEINIVCCPSCNAVFYAENFILYQDPRSEILAFVQPLSFAPEVEHWELKMKDDFKKALNELSPEDRPQYSPVLLFGMESLVELIKDDDADIDEAAILEYSSKELGLVLIPLHPHLARMKRLPRILPLLYSKGKVERDDVINGLEKLVGHNPHLAKYTRLLNRIKRDKKWVLNPDFILRKKAVR